MKNAPYSVALLVLLTMAGCSSEQTSKVDECVNKGYPRAKCETLDGHKMLCASGAINCGHARSPKERIENCILFYEIAGNSRDIPDNYKGTGPGRTACEAHEMKGWLDPSGQSRGYSPS